MLSRAHHFSITVLDLERSIHWYEDLFGLEVTLRQRNDNEYTRELVGIDDAVLDIAFLALPGSEEIALELIEYVRPKGAVVTLATNSPGVAHVAFVVPDIDEVVRRVASGEGRMVSPPVEVDQGVNRGTRACYLRDPDGFTVELMQRPAPAGEPGRGGPVPS